MDREVPQVPPAPSFGAVRGVPGPSCRAGEDLLADPTAEQECSADSAFCPAALGSEDERGEKTAGWEEL